VLPTRQLFPSIHLLPSPNFPIWVGSAANSPTLPLHHILDYSSRYSAQDVWQTRSNGVHETSRFSHPNRTRGDHDAGMEVRHASLHSLHYDSSISYFSKRLKASRTEDNPYLQSIRLSRVYGHPSHLNTAQVINSVKDKLAYFQDLPGRQFQIPYPSQ
jgi:hypothetical protein